MQIPIVNADQAGKASLTGSEKPSFRIRADRPGWAVKRTPGAETRRGCVINWGLPYQRRTRPWLSLWESSHGGNAVT